MTKSPGRHHGALARDGGIGVLALDHEAQRRRDMAMRRRDLAGQDDLQAGKEAAGDAGFALHAGVFEHQHAALGFLGGDDLAGFHQIGADLAPFPDRRLARALGLVEHQPTQHAPQRRQILFTGAAVEFLPAFLGLAVYGVGKAVIGHRNLLANIAMPKRQKARISARNGSFARY